MALVRTVDVSELKPQPRAESQTQRQQLQSAQRLRATLGERSVAKQLERVGRSARGSRP